jgi:putative membrane protein
MKRMVILAAWACLVSAGPAFAQYSKPKPAADPKSAAAEPSPAARYAADMKAARARGRTPDAAFVIAAAQSGLAGVTFSRMALEKAADPAVKRFARQIAEASGKMSEELKPLLAAQRAAVPTELEPRLKAAEEALAKLSGADFDRAYMSSMQAMRTTDLLVFERAATKAHDAGLKAWASKNLPALKGQQAAATEINKKIAG